MNLTSRKRWMYTTIFAILFFTAGHPVLAQMEEWDKLHMAAINEVQSGDLDQGFTLAKQAYNAVKKQKQRGESYFKIAYQLDSLALVLWDLKLADTLSQELLSNMHRTTTNPKRYQKVQQIQAWVALRLNRLEEAQVLAKEGLRQLAKKQHQERGEFFKILGMVYLGQENIKRAEIFFEKAYNNYTSATRPDSLSIAELYWHKGQLAFFNADYEKAKQDFRQAEILLESQQHISPTLLAQVLEWQAYNYLTLSKTALAQDLYKSAEKIWKSFAFHQHPAYARVIEGLALLAIMTQDLEKAERYYQEALRINIEYFGLRSHQKAETLSNLSQLKSQLMNHDEALELAEEALSMVNPKTHLSIYCNLLNNYGAIYLNQDSIEKAGKQFERVIQIREKKYGKNNLSLAATLNNYGLFLEVNSDPAKALDYYLRCYQMLKKNGETASKLFGDVTTNLGYYYEYEARNSEDSLLQKDYFFKSITYFKEGVKASEQSLGVLHPDYINSLFHMAVLLDYQGKIDQSATFYQSAIDRMLQLILRVYGGFDEGTQLRYIDEVGKKLALFYSFAHRNKTSYPNLLKKVAEVHYAVKNLSIQYSILNQIRAMVEVQIGKNPIYQEWKKIKEKLAIDYLKRQEIKDPVLEEKIKQQEQALAQVEKDVARDPRIRSVIFNPYQPYEKIRAHIKPEEFFIDFLQFPYWDPIADRFTDTLYSALIHSNSSQYPDYVPLLRQKELLVLLRQDTNAQSITNTRKFPSYIEYPQLAHPIYQQLWQPILGKIPSQTRIHFAPDGLLHQIALENLPIDERGQQRIGDQYQLLRYSSFKDFTQSHPKKFIKQLIGFGGIDYSSGSSQRTNTAYFQALNGSLAEVQAIKEIGETYNWDINLYTGFQATEAQFKKHYQTGERGVLLLSTHAFFIAQDDEPEQGSIEEGSFLDLLKKAKNPLLKSGIAFAGANKAGESSFNLAEEDGVLNALEISTLDFSKTNLVILSACETALGEIRSIEGVFGLQRALKQAGAHQILLSLWEVPDKQTKEFMIHFFEAFSKEQNADQALRYAQQQMRNNDISAPYWAAFILLQ